MVAMPVTVLLFVLVKEVRPDRNLTPEYFLGPALMTVIVAPLVRGLLRGATWARIASIVANLAWGVFMATLVVVWARLLRAAPGESVGDLVISAVQVALVFFALVDLVWPRSAATSSAPRG